MGRICSQCKKENLEEAQFCEYCGCKLKEEKNTEYKKKNSNISTTIFMIIVCLVAGVFIGINTNKDKETYNKIALSAEEQKTVDTIMKWKEEWETIQSPGTLYVYQIAIHQYGKYDYLLVMYSDEVEKTQPTQYFEAQIGHSYYINEDGVGQGRWDNIPNANSGYHEYNCNMTDEEKERVIAMCVKEINADR